MPREEAIKDLTLGEKRYQIEKMSAVIASRVHGWLSYAAIALMQKQNSNGGGSSEVPTAAEIEAIPIQERAEGTVGMLWIGASSALPEETYAKIQNYCLRSLKYYDADISTWAPVLMPDGRWASKDLEKDGIAVDELIKEVLQFNIAPFFVAGFAKAQSTPKPAS